MSTHTRPSLDELQQAYRAAARGDFRTAAPAPARVGSTWEPTEPVVLVAGCHGGAGASILAAAIATAHQGSSRVVECRGAASAFCAAATAELGQSASGWVAGARGPVRLERASGLPLTPGEVSVPDPAPDSTNLTVLDLSWDPRVLARAAGWLSTALFTAPAPVLVATATAPGVRHLEAVLHVLPEEATPVAILRVGHRQRRWPTTVHQQTGPRTRALHDAGRLLQFPTEPQLAVTGLDTGPLSRTVVAAAADVLDLACPDAHHTTTPTTKEMNR